MFILKLPSKLVAVPMFVPLIFTLTPINVSFVCPSTTLPLILICAKLVNCITTKQNSKRVFIKNFVGSQITNKYYECYFLQW